MISNFKYEGQMYTSTEIERHVSGLRRFARLHMGDQRRADGFVAEAVHALSTDRRSPRGTLDPRLALYQRFFEVLAQMESRYSADGENLQTISISHRAYTQRHLALLLTAVEKFTFEEAGLLLGKLPTEVEQMVRRAKLDLKKVRGEKVLLGSPHGIVGYDLEMALNSYGYDVIPHALDSASALAGLEKMHLDIIVVDVDHVEHDSLALLRRASEKTGAKVVVLSSSEDSATVLDLVPRSIFLSKPFHLQAFRAAIASIAPPERFTKNVPEAPDLSEPDITILEALDELEEAQRRLGPLKVIIENDQVRLAAGSPPRSTLFPLDDLEALRSDYWKDAKRIVEYGANVSRVFEARITSVFEILGERLTDQSTLRLAAQVRALERMRSAVRDAMVAETAADVEALIDGLSSFVRRFPVWRHFVAEAERSEGVGAAAREAISALAAVIAQQPDDLVEDKVKHVVEEVRTAAASPYDILTDQSEVRAVSAPFAGIAQYLLERKKGIAQAFNGAIDKEVGEGLAKVIGQGLINVMILGAPALLTLATQMPLQFAWVGPVLVALRIVNK